VALMRLAEPVATQNSMRLDRIALPSSWFDMLVIGLALILVLPPLASLVIQGLTQISFNARLLSACATSLMIGTTSSITATALALGLGQSTKLQPVAVLGLVVPPAVIATGWFIATLPLDLGIIGTLALIILLNALMALPFAYGALAPALAQHRIQTERLVQQLDIRGWCRIKQIDWPLLRRPLSQAALMALVLSLGDLTAVLLLGNNGIESLPALLHAQMGSYRFGAAEGTALMLALLCLVLTMAAQRLGDQR
jgi:thiamine transport system permease protein